MTEDELVGALRAIVEAPTDNRSAAWAIGKSVALGIGDDAAAWQPSRSHLSVITSDALVDGVHFLSTAMDPAAIGWRALAANLSDVAAMGARPVLATIALGIAPETGHSFVLACYRGMAELAAQHATRIVGGDIVRAPALTLALTVVGEVSRTRLKRRSGGRPTDVLAVTGPLGLARAGLALVRRPEIEVESASRDAALAAFATPAPRVREGRWLGASAHVHAMMDLSDGLSTDVARLAKASGCGALLDEPPLHPAVSAVAVAAADSPEEYALDGGEDFELLVSIAPRAFGYLAARFAGRFGRALTPVGRLDAEPEIRIRRGGIIAPLPARGYDHLAETVNSRPDATDS